MSIFPVIVGIDQDAVLIAQLEGRIALVLDGGTTPGGLSSTIVDCTTDQVKILRQGAISEAEIENVLASVV